MDNKIRVRLCGGASTYPAQIERAEKAFRQLGWKISRIYLSDTIWSVGIENAENRIAYYRNAGLDEKYISIIPIQQHPAFFRTEVSNFGIEEDTAQEQLIFSIWKEKKGTGGYCRILYSGIPLNGVEGAVSCDINFCGSRVCFIYVTVAEGYSRRTAWHIAEKFADEMGMKVDRRMSKSRYEKFPGFC